MVQTVASTKAGALVSTIRDEYTKAFRWMLLARTLDDKFAGLYRAGKIHGGVFLGRGQEALSVSVGLALRKGDVFAPLIRDQAGRLAFGEPILDAVRTYLGSTLGPMRGRDGNIHRGRPREGLLPMISHLGAMIAVVNGILFARRLRNISGVVGAASIGDGGTSTGSFHEAINLAARVHDEEQIHVPQHGEAPFTPASSPATPAPAGPAPPGASASGKPSPGALIDLNGEIGADA